MKVGRTILSVIGIIAIALTYVTKNLYFLALAVIVFFIGLVMMGAIGKPKQNAPETSKAQKRNTRR